MSWQDKITQPYTITTGDGKVYTPLWNPQESVQLIQEFNISKFNFRGLKGTLVDRGEVMGNVFDIQIYFAGADHLNQAEAFRNSAKNKKAWIVSHPYYGAIKVQPVGIRYDNSDGNITRLNAQIIETIDPSTVSTSVNQRDKIAIDKIEVDTALAARYLSDVPAPKVIDIQGMTADVLKVDSQYAPLIKLSENYNAFKTGVARANSYIAKATVAPANAIGSIQSVISAPAVFLENEASRLLMLANAYKGLYRYAVNLPRSIKLLYQTTAGSLISTMCLAVVSDPANDYRTRPAVVSVISVILTTYNEYIGNLDTLQTANGGEINSYIPDSDSVGLLTSLVAYTVGQLLIIAAEAKQEQRYVLPEDSNVTLIAYQLYGTAADEIVDQLIADNGMNYTEFLVVKKGREIIYYV